MELPALWNGIVAATPTAPLADPAKKPPIPPAAPPATVKAHAPAAPPNPPATAPIPKAANPSFQLCN